MQITTKTKKIFECRCENGIYATSILKLEKRYSFFFGSVSGENNELKCHMPRNCALDTSNILPKDQPLHKAQQAKASAIHKINHISYQLDFATSVGFLRFADEESRM